MTPLGLLGPLASEWLRDNKVVGCPHPHVPSGNDYSMVIILSHIFIFLVHTNFQLLF